MTNAPEMDIFSASFENNLHTSYILANMNSDQNTSGSQTLDLETTNKRINSCEVSVETKFEYHTDQNCNDSKTEIGNDNEYQISSNRHMLDILTDLSVTNIDRQLYINTEFDTIMVNQANSDHFTDSGCFSSQSTIDNGSDIPPKDVNDSINDLISSNESHLIHPNDVKNFNFVKNLTFDNEFKDNDLDSNCSGYNSSDFEFIDENEAKMFNIELDTDIASRSDVNNEVSLDFSKDSNESFGNCLSNLKAEGDDFLVLFQSAAAHNLDFVEHKCNFIPSTNRPRLRFEIENFDECNDSEDVVKDAKETEKNIFSMYPRQNRYYKAFL
ncbi:PREDICTED: uncharacterized protein LOC106101831 isoform X2 [Papilio polytes]|uniref:uncharacterized protein LOC106101831 isoform X2 n=1 Tax=Papilio polytes TaxID=76194 RepID=UPI00067684FC|nr:PREDICTED: uncharacterized protein LOC106101831 isoform X2 [Papilio polytes]